MNIEFFPSLVDPRQWRWPAPFAPRALPRFIATTKQSAPGWRIGTFGLAVGAACAFSPGIAVQVLTFRTRAWSNFAPPTRRMPLGRSQASPELIPEEGSPPGSDIAKSAFDTSAAVRLRSPLSTVPNRDHRPDISATFTTTAFDRSSLQWLEIGT